MRWSFTALGAIALTLVLPACGGSGVAPGFPDAGIADAYRGLQEAGFFSSTCVGIAASTPPAVPLWEQIMGHPRAVEHFLALLTAADCAGQLYALAGIYVLDRSEFDDRIQGYLDSDEQVHVVAGCIGGVEDVCTIAGDIQTGEVPRRLLDLDCPR